jgi:trigger factor
LDIILDKKTNTEACIKIKLNEADYQPKVEEKVKEYSKKANIKGFRPGKVPSSLIKKMYGKSILVDEVSQLLSESLQNYIRENKVPVIGEPLPNESQNQKIDWDNQKDFEFVYDIGLVEDFKYDLSKSVKVKAYEIKIDDKVLNETLDRLKQDLGNHSNPEASQKGDSIYGELKEKNGDFATHTLIPLEKVQEKELSKFVGVKKDDIIVFDIKKAFKDNADIAAITKKEDKEAANIKGEFEFKVENINRIEKAELNQEFFDKVFGKDAVKSEEEFIAKVKETLSENYKRETDFLLDQDIQKKLLETVKFELPDEFLKRWLLISNEGKITEEDIKKEYELYAKDLKWTLIKNKIAEDNDIKAEHEEILNKTKDMIRQQLASSGLAGQMEDSLDMFATNYLQKDKGEQYMKMFNQVRSEKILNLIKEKIDIDNKKVDIEEFKKIVSN